MSADELLTEDELRAEIDREMTEAREQLALAREYALACNRIHGTDIPIPGMQTL